MSDKITWGLRPDSIDSSDTGRTYRYVLAGIFDHAMARAYALAATPQILDGLWRQDVKVSAKGFKIWYVDIQYGPVQKEEPGETFSWSFDTTGGTAKITQAKQHIASFAPPGKTPPNHHGAIGVNDRGDVEGVEIVVPNFRWEEKHVFDARLVGWGYSQVLKALTGFVNAESFRGFPAGQVRFDGGRGGASNKDPKHIEITYLFAQSDDVTGVTSGNITGISKGGWQYIWYEYETTDDTQANRKAKQPIAAHVEQVYYPANFTLLGIGS